MKKCALIVLKSFGCLLLLSVGLAALSGISPVYDFAPAHPFAGPDIFNPYAGFDAALLKKANFHTHSRVDGLLNECEHDAAYVDSCYRSFGYDIVTFSNHNELTAYPADTVRRVNVYEHGYNLFKYHKLVFGAPSVLLCDQLLPLTASQRQFQLDMLGKKADLIQLNHPFRTIGTTRGIMEKLSGYQLTELDSGISVDNEYWDWALSVGHYSRALANDDLHDPDSSWKFARRCNFLCCGTDRREDVMECLRSGAFYCMRMPDYGDGNWDEKRRRNADLPAVADIGLEGSEAFIRLSRPAGEIRAVGQDGKVLSSVADSPVLRYDFAPEDAYVRFVAFFPEGEVIYTNVFARYDASLGDSPSCDSPHSVNWLLTLLLNAMLLGLCYLCLALGVRICRREPRCRSCRAASQLK